jgi:HSP20 family protein
MSDSTTPIDRIRGELNKVIDAVRQQGEKALEAMNLGGKPGLWLPAVDILEKTDEVQVVVDVPGVDPAGIDVTLVGNMLTLRGSRSPAPPGGTPVRRERPAGAFEVSIPLPAPVEADGVLANCKLGVLSVTLLKRRDVQAPVVRVNVATDDAGSAS